MLLITPNDKILICLGKEAIQFCQDLAEKIRN